MQVLILATPDQRAALLGHSTPGNADLIWAESPAALAGCPGVDGIVDLLFENSPARLTALQQKLPLPVIVNSVVHTLDELPEGFVRINGWPGCLSGPLVEAAAGAAQRPAAEKIFALFNKSLTWLPDKPGFITPRIISMIINEACRAAAEGVSTPEAMNTAMKLGTNYPHGPFEWAEMIGLEEVHALLEKLAGAQERYRPMFKI